MSDRSPLVGGRGRRSVCTLGASAEGGRLRGLHHWAMAHTLIERPADEVAVQPGAVVSKVVHRGDGLNVTVFAFDTGEQLSEHSAARAALVQVQSGRLRFVVDGEELDLTDGSWLYMAPGAPHSLVATEPTVMLLTLFG
jgi:quercetin dioxygenase-like cupin family protein